MPIVPTTGGPRVDLNPMPRVQAPLDAFGGGNAARPVDVSGITDVSTKLYEQARQRANETATLDAASSLSSGETALMHDPAHGVLNLRGKDAAGAIDQAQQRYQSLTSSIEAGLTNDDQKLAFRRMAASRWNAINEQVQTHMAAERDEYDTKTYTSFIANETNAAVASAATDPKRAEEAVTLQRAATQDFGRRRGWSADTIAQAETHAVSATRVGVLEQMLDGRDDVSASQYFAAHRDEILPDQQRRIEKALTAASALGTAQRTVDQILAKSTTPTEALAQAEAISDPNARHDATEMVMAHFNNLDRAQRIERESARAKIMSDMEKHGGRLNTGSLDWQAIDGHPEGEQVLERQRQILHPPPDPGDPDKYNSYVAMAAISPATRQQLVTTNITDVVNDATLSHGQKTAIINLIRGERQRDVTDLHRQAGEAETEARRLQSAVAKAQKDGDTESVDANTPLLYAAQQRATILKGQLITATRTSRSAGITVPDDGASSIPASPSAAQPARPSGLGAFGLAPVAPKPLTPDMVHDLAEYGEGYAAHLRAWGYAVPKVLPKPDTKAKP